MLLTFRITFQKLKLTIHLMYPRTTFQCQWFKHVVANAKKQHHSIQDSSTASLPCPNAHTCQVTHISVKRV